MYNVFQVGPVALLLPSAPASAAAHACPLGPRLLARRGALPARARRAVRMRSWLSTGRRRASASRRAAARAPQVKTDDEDVTAEDMQGHVLSILAGGAGAHLGDKRRRAAAARA